MALNITIEGTGVIADCDAITDTQGGTHFELGQGSIAVSTDVYLINGSSIGGKYAAKSGMQAIDKGSGLYDFTSGGAQEGELIYIWIAATAIGTLDTKANNAFCIRVSSGGATNATSNYLDFLVASNDDSNGWTGAWKCFVIDPTVTPTRFDGTIATILANVRSIGMWIDCSGTARADSFFIGGIAIGKGLRIKGTSSTGWLDAVNYCTDYTTRGWGMLEQRGKTYFAKGQIFIGDPTQASSTIFTDTARSIEFEASEYWSGSAWVSALSDNSYGIILEDTASVTTTFADGILVGSDNGRSGSTFTGTNTENVFFDASGLTHTDSSVRCYGTKFQSLYGPITMEADVDHKFYACNVIDCAQVIPTGAPVIRNCIFAETADIDAAVLWNGNIDMRNCTFIANTTGAAIEHPNNVGNPFDYYDLTFSGNTFDGLNTAASNLTVNNNGTSNAALDEGTNTITYLSSATLTMTVLESDGTPVNGAYAYIDDNNQTPFIMNTTTNASGVASVGHTAGAVTGATWRVRKYGYRPFVVTADIPASGLKEIPVTLIVDPQQT